MRITVLGASAGGGLPQWNCACPNCQSARTGGEVLPRTQSALAVAAGDRRWVLVNASPDIGAQLRATPALWPASDGGQRGSPISAVLLTNADVDHIAGLLTLRESQPFELCATPSVLETLRANRVFDALNADHVTRSPLELDHSRPLPGDGRLTVTPFAVPGKVALFLETPDTLARSGARSEDTIGLEFRDAVSGTRAVVIPGCADIDDELKTRIDGADVLLFDGTVYNDDEMITAGLSQKTGRRMGHVPMAGLDGSLAGLADVRVGRRVFIHINNSNPVLQPSSGAACVVADVGWEIAFDGMDITV